MIWTLWIGCAAPPPPPPPPPAPEPAPQAATPCEGGDAIACLPLADEARRAGDFVRAAELYEARCRVQPGDVACTLAELARGQQALAAACPDDPEACKELCTRTLEASSCATAAEGWRPACEAGDGPSCLHRAEAMEAAGAAPEAVAELLWVACDDSDPVEPWACLRLADHVERGHSALPARARGDIGWLRNQACDLQLDYACAPHRGW